MTQAKGQQSRRSPQVRDFKGMNATDARTAIDDGEFAWLENAMPIGKGKVQITPASSTPLATITAGVAELQGFVLNGTPTLLTINQDGTISSVNTVAPSVTTVVPTPGSIRTDAAMALWKGETVLFADATNGYMQYSPGATPFSILDAGVTGTTLAVSQGRAWIGNGRQVTFTAAGTLNDFIHDGGSFTITDEAFPGNVVDVLDAFQQLWIIGGGAVNAISNVQVVSGVATFSNTNLISGLGTANRRSVLAFFRSLAFLSPGGVYALTGVTPQKLSDKLDGLFPTLTLTPDTPVALATVYQIPVLCFLVTYRDPKGPRPILLCYAHGKWFLSSQGPLTAITSVVTNGEWLAYGTDGHNIFQLFADPDSPVSYVVKSKLFDFGSMITTHELFRFLLEFNSAAGIAPTVTVETEKSSIQAPLTFNNFVLWINNAGAIVPWFGSAQNPAVWFSSAPVYQGVANAPGSGRYGGWTLTGTDVPFSISGWALEIEDRREW